MRTRKPDDCPWEFEDIVRNKLADLLDTLILAIAAPFLAAIFCTEGE